MPAGRPLLQRLIERMHRQHATGPLPMTAGDVASAVLDSLHGRLSRNEAFLLREVAGLARIIEQAKADIAAVNAGEIRAGHIPLATGELDAVVAHTALATEGILAACEMLDRLGATLGPADAARLQRATTQIYEACTFQDITGQRISKVVAALQAIEAKVSALTGTGGRTAALQDAAGC